MHSKNLAAFLHWHGTLLPRIGANVDAVYWPYSNELLLRSKTIDNIFNFESYSRLFGPIAFDQRKYNVSANT